MPRSSLEQKNVLIVPLSLFIRFNKKIASEKFANLFGKFFDEIFSCDEELKDHEKFREHLIEKILRSQLVTDFNLGKKTKQEFISELLDFLKLSNDKTTAIEAAWNSLLEFDPTSNEAFDALIKLTHQGKSIYFIGNTNELHAKKILNLFACFPFKPRQFVFLKNLPQSVLAVPLAVNQVSESGRDGNGLALQRDTLFFCLSYVYKTFLEQPQDYLTLLNPIQACSWI